MRPEKYIQYVKINCIAVIILNYFIGNGKKKQTVVGEF